MLFYNYFCKKERVNNFWLWNICYIWYIFLSEKMCSCNYYRLIVLCTFFISVYCIIFIIAIGFTHNMWFFRLYLTFFILMTYFLAFYIVHFTYLRSQSCVRKSSITFKQNIFFVNVINHKKGGSKHFWIWATPLLLLLRRYCSFGSTYIFCPIFLKLYSRIMPMV